VTSPADDPTSIVRLSEALDRMETWRDTPGTIPLHDAAWALVTALREGGPADASRQALAVALAACPDHPAVPLLAPLISGGTAPGPRSRGLEEVVGGIRGLPARADLGEALERYLHDLGEQRRLLEQRGEELTRRLARVQRSLDLAVGVVVLAALLALAGWSAALGWIDVPGAPALPIPGSGDNRYPEPRPEPPP
jgi:hypothetical protein